MNTQVPQGFPQYGGGPHPPKRGIRTGWIIAIVAVVVVVMAGVAVGVIVFLSSDGSSYDKADGKYGTGALPSCDDVASRVGNLPSKSTDTKLEGNQGWLCTFADSADALTVSLDLEVNTVQRQRTKFDVGTSSGAYVVDTAVQLGERAAWGVAPSGQTCDLIVLDSNAEFKVSLDDWHAAREDTQTCKDRVKIIAQAFYATLQPR